MNGVLVDENAEEVDIAQRTLMPAVKQRNVKTKVTQMETEVTL